MGHKYTKILGDGVPGETCLYLGSIDWVIEDDILEDLHIHAIVSVLPRQPQYAGEVLTKHRVLPEDYLVYPLEDSNDEYISLFDAPGILATCNFIHCKRQEGKNVLVHCDAGVTRSPAVVISYLMRFGVDLRTPRPLSLAEALAFVKRLRERVDVCAFHEELVRLEAQLGKGDLDVNPILRKPSAPISPQSPPSWEALREAGDPFVDLSTLRSTWRAVRALDGGEESLGRAVYRTVLELGGRRMEDMYAEVDMQRLSGVMTAMLRQIVWCLDANNLDRLVRFHHHLAIVSADFLVFHTAIVRALKDKVQLPDESVLCWNRFLGVVFSRWAKAIGQPPLEEQLAPSLPLGHPPADLLDPSAAGGGEGCPFARRPLGAEVQVKGRLPLGLKLAIPLCGQHLCG